MAFDVEPGGRGGFLAPDRIFEAARPLVGMVHLPALPGSPGWGGSMDHVLARAREDARRLEEGGMDGVLVENYGDVPFLPGAVGPETVAALAVVVARLREVVSLPVGVNVLRNDAGAALAVAAASGARFVRVNVHSGVMFTDQGLVEGRAHETLRSRRALGAPVALFADVLVKHAHPPPGVTLEGAARELRRRGRADVLVVSGSETGAPPDANRIRRVREAVPDAPLWLGSGLSPETAPTLLPLVDGAIVGSCVQRHGKAGTGVDPERLRRLVQAARGVR